MVRRLIIAFVLLALGVGYVLDAIGWRTSDPKPDGIAVVSTFGELLAQPSFALGPDARVRVGLERRELGLIADGAFLYLAFERDAVALPPAVLAQDLEPLSVLVRASWGPGPDESEDHVVLAFPQAQQRGALGIGRALRLLPIHAVGRGVTQIAVFRMSADEDPWNARNPQAVPFGDPLVEGHVRVREVAPWVAFDSGGLTQIAGVTADARLLRSDRIIRPGQSSVPLPLDLDDPLPRATPQGVDPTLYLTATPEGFELTSEWMIPFQFPEQYLLARVRVVEAEAAPPPRPRFGQRAHVLRARVDWRFAAIGAESGDTVSVELIWNAGGVPGIRLPPDVQGDLPRRSNASVFTLP